MREHAILAEELGYESIWTSDYLVATSRDSDPTFAGWQILAAWAAVTTRLRIGMLASANTFRHPAILAKMIATLDHISGGRIIAGLGAGGGES